MNWTSCGLIPNITLILPKIRTSHSNPLSVTRIICQHVYKICSLPTPDIKSFIAPYKQITADYATEKLDAAGLTDASGPVGKKNRNSVDKRKTVRDKGGDSREKKTAPTEIYALSSVKAFYDEGTIYFNILLGHWSVEIKPLIGPISIYLGADRAWDQVRLLSYFALRIYFKTDLTP